MSRLVRLLLLTLVAVWLPVTLHCKLEAAGVFSGPDACCASEPAAASADNCKDDACPTVEDTLFKESSQGLKVSAPAQTVCLVCLALVPALEPVAEPALSPARHPPPLDLQAAWQFLSRAAPPARAPSLNT